MQSLLLVFLLIQTVFVIILCDVPNISITSFVSLLLLMSASWVTAYNMAQHKVAKSRPDEYEVALQTNIHDYNGMPKTGGCGCNAGKKMHNTHSGHTGPASHRPNAPSHFLEGPQGPHGPHGSHGPHGPQGPHGSPDHSQNADHDIHVASEKDPFTFYDARVVLETEEKRPHHPDMDLRCRARENVIRRFGHPSWHDPVRNQRLVGADNPRRWEQDATHYLQPLAGPQEREPYNERDKSITDTLLASRQYLIH